MSAERRWKFATACMSLVASIAIAYAVAQRGRLARATRFAYAGMTSVGYVCLVVADVLRSPEPPEEVLRPADACLGQSASDAELLARRAEIDAKDYAAVAARITAQINDNRLPIGSIKYSSYYSESELPKGLRDD